MKICTINDCDRSAERSSGGRTGRCASHYRHNDTRYIKPIRKHKLRNMEGILERDELGRKRCTDCLRWLPESGFPKNSKRVDGFTPHCRDCAVCREHGISYTTYCDMLESQGGVCAICGGAQLDGFGRLSIDHDKTHCSYRYSCGECIRGLLCMPCNAGIGLLGDNADGLRCALKYLENTENSSL